MLSRPRLARCTFNVYTTIDFVCGVLLRGYALSRDSDSCMETWVYPPAATSDAYTRLGRIQNSRPAYGCRGIAMHACMRCRDKKGKKSAGRKWACLGDVVDAGRGAVDGRGQPQSDAPGPMPSSDGATLRDVLRSVKVLIPASVYITQSTFSTVITSLTSIRQVPN